MAVWTPQDSTTVRGFWSSRRVFVSFMTDETWGGTTGVRFATFSMCFLQASFFLPGISTSLPIGNVRRG